MPEGFGNPVSVPRVVPTAFLLQAAMLAASVFSERGNTLKSVLSSYRAVVSGGLYRVEDLQRGETLLLQAGLVRIRDDRIEPDAQLIELRGLPSEVACELLLRRILLAEQPLWLYAAVESEDVLWENVPDADQRVLAQLIEDAARREAFLLSLAKTIDLAHLADLGADGEEFILAQCRIHLKSRDRADLAEKVRRVSLKSDQLGYDITATDTHGVRHRIEVKTMATAVDRADFFLSRNESRTGQNDPHWALVLVARNPDGSFRILGWCRSNVFLHLLPVDSSADGRWVSVRLSLPLHLLEPGLPLE